MNNKSLKHILGAIAIAIASQAHAQDLPKTFNYQAMINAEDGSPIANKDITVEVSILQGSDCGSGAACPVIWQELHTPATNDFGLFSIEIGSQDAISTMQGTARKYSDINWLDISSGEYFLKVRVDFGEASYLNGMTDLGTTRFSAVPYSLVALKCDKSAKADELSLDASGKSKMSLGQLKDVTVKSPSKNQILAYDGTAWKNTDPAAAQGLTNIDISSPAEGQYLVYSASSGKWANKTFPGIAMSGLSDASISTLNNKDVLVYSLSSQKWINKPLTIQDIQGMTSPNSGDVIQYDGRNWKPAPLPEQSQAAVSIKDLKDVALNSLSNKQVLSYNSATLKWENIANDNIWTKAASNSYYTLARVGIGSELSKINSDEKDKNDLLKLAASTQGTTHFTGKGLTIGNSANRALGVGSIALAAGSNIEASACIGGNGASIGEYATNSIVMGVSSSTLASGSIVVGDNSKCTDANSAVFGSYLTSVGGSSIVTGFYNASSTTQLLAVGNGTSAARSTAFAVDKSGDVYVAGALAHSSDSRLKTSVSTIGGALESVMKMRGVTFYWDKGVAANASASQELQYGFIAQEIEKIFPSLVSTGANGYKSVNYIGIIPVMAQAVKEQQQEIESLRKENEQLKSALESLIKRVEALEKK